MLSITSVKTSGCHYTFPGRELKDTQEQFTENLWTLTIEIFPSTSNSLITIGNFLKHLTLVHIRVSFFCSLYSYSWLLQWIYICSNEMNIWKIKYHSYKVLNLQVNLIVLVLTHGNQWFLGIFLEKRWFLLQKCNFFYFYPLKMNFWTINAHNNEELTIKHWEKILCEVCGRFSWSFLHQYHLALW